MTTTPVVNRKDRSDLWATIVCAVLAAVVTIAFTIIRLLDLFAVDGITATARLDGVPGELPIGPSRAPVSGRLHEVSFTATAMFACIALGAVAVALRAGERLQRETEGLV